MRTRPSRRAFSLLELITATAIMAMIALSLYQAMRVGFKARDRATAMVGPSRAGELAIDMVRRDVEAALPLRGVLAGTGMLMGGPGYEAPGTSHVQFYMMSPAPQTGTNASTGFGSASSRGPSAMDREDATAYGGVRRVELLVRASAGGGPNDGATLVRRVTRNLLAPTELAPEEQILCRGVSAFTIRYFDGLQWYDEWDSTQYGDTLPMAVEVTLEVRGSQDPTRLATDSRAGAANETAYRTSRTFLLPCRDEAALSQGVTQ
jgi:prepilin-type N-terminal cleavage/methylation domain-containing protein